MIFGIVANDKDSRQVFPEIVSFNLAAIRGSRSFVSLNGDLVNPENVLKAGLTASRVNGGIPVDYEIDCKPIEREEFYNRLGVGIDSLLRDDYERVFSYQL